MKSYKKWLRVTLPVLALGLSGVSYAQGTRTGNGGDALICTNPQTGVITASLLDVWEAEMKGIALSFPGSTLEEKVTYLMLRLATVDPSRAQKYAPTATVMAKDLTQGASNPGARQTGHVQWLDTELVDIEDSHEILISKDCRKVQLVIQIPDTKRLNESDAKYYVHRSAWGKLSLDNQAATVLHEVIYGEAFERGHHDSFLVREFNRMILQDGFATIPDEKYKAALKKMNFVFVAPTPAPTPVPTPTPPKNDAVQALLQSGQKTQVEFILSCIRENVKKRRGGKAGYDQSLDQLNWIHDAIVQENTELLSRASQQCLEVSRMKKDRKFDTPQSNPILREFKRPYLLTGECESWNFAARAGFGVGAGVKLGYSVCNCTDGSRSLYAVMSPSLAFGVAGANVGAAHRKDADQPGLGLRAKAPSGQSQSSALKDRFLRMSPSVDQGLIQIPLLQIDMDAEYNEKPIVNPAIGLEFTIGGYIDLLPAVRIAKLKDNWDRVIRALVPEGVVIKQ